MEQKPDWYLNADEYGAEVIEHVRNLAGGYLEWKKTSPFTDTYKEEIRAEAISEPGKEELQRIVRAGKKSYAKIEQKAVRSAAEHVVIPLEYLFKIRRAGDFLRHCVCLSLASELDGDIGSIYADIPENHGKLYPTVELCECLYSVEKDRRLNCMHSLFEEKEAFRFFFGGELPLGIRTELRLEQRILQFIFSPESEPEALQSFTQLYYGSELIDKPLVIREELADQLAEYLKETTTEKKIIYLFGKPGSGRRFLIRHACARNRVFCLEADAGKLNGVDADRLLNEIIRETVIRRAVLCIRDFQQLFLDTRPFQALYTVRQLLKALPVVILTADQKWPSGLEDFPVPVTELELTEPGVEDRIRIWLEAFRQYPKAMPEPFKKDHKRLEGLAGKFSFQPGQIMEAVREAERNAGWSGKEVEEDTLYQACRSQVNHRLGEKAMRIKASYGWDDLILPPDRKQMLKNACDQIEYSHQVYGTWGFAAKMAYGRGISMLFYGPPGTGKTMGAQVLARELHLELYKADLSSVMSKYIGETEKNLGEIFEEVKKSQSILFFDEADVLFGKRSEVKDAQDKYANAETAYLLQKMEEYEGIVILATNYMQNFDEAFKRRIRFMIEFPLPDAKRRFQIWQQVYPDTTPVSEDVDFDFLASQFELSGSSIKNIAVSAAFRAAAAGTKVEMGQLLDCLREEMKKSGKNLQSEDFGPYYSLMNGG